MKGTYIGNQHFLKCKTALLRPAKEAGFILAQFDDLKLPLHVTHGWRRFKSSEFDIETPSDNEPGNALPAGLPPLHNYMDCDPLVDRFPGPPRSNY